jgi:type VI secretion system Hcp family effector
MSKASPLIIQRLATGQHITQADLVFRKSGKDQVEFLRIDLDDVLIASYRVTTAPDGSPLEEYTLDFNKARLQYTEQKDDGSLGSPVVFQEQDLGVEHFNPPQPSLLQSGYALSGTNDYFLDIDGIKGESHDAKHADALDIQGFSWGGSASVGSFGGGGGAGKTTFHEMHFVAPVSKASPVLMQRVATGQHIKNAHFTAVHSGLDQFQFLDVTLEDILVSSYQVVLGEHNQLVEEFTLNFKNADVEFTPHDDTGRPGTPVEFSGTGLFVGDFKPEQRALIGSNVQSPANIDAFLSVDGVQGESQDAKHEGDIDLLSFSWGADAAFDTSGGGGGSGKATMQELHFTTRLSAASPTLLDFMDDGRHVRTADLVLRKAGKDEVEFYKVKLEDLIVSSYQLTTAQDGSPLEEYTLNFAKSSLDYFPQKPDGSADLPVHFQETGLAAEDFAPVQRSIIQNNPTLTSPTLDYFLDIDGIAGESQDAKHANQIDVLAFSWGGNATAGTLGGGGGTGKTTYHEFHFVSRVSKASPKILDRLLKGQHTPDATLAVVKPTSGEILKIRLVDVIISSYQVTTALDGTVIEEFTLSFGPSAVFGAPIADAGGPYSVGDGQSVTLDGTGSFDPDQDADTLTYEWDLDGDGVFGETGAGATRGDETGATPDFSAAGLFGPQTLTVSLRVTDATGKTDTDTATITIVDITPPETIILSGPPTLTNQTSATFTFTGTDQGTPADQLTFTAEIDGAARVAVASPLTLTGLSDGVHTIKLFAKDLAGNEDPTPATYTWKVDTKPPAVLDAAAAPTPIGSPVTLTAKISDVLAGNTNIASAQYSLDGITWLPMSATDGAFNSPEEAVKATFGPLAPGVYTLRIRGTDAAGNTSIPVTLELPVFDPDKFVTGGGFIKTSTGAKADININVGYDHNETTPDGRVTFKLGSLNFASTDLDYLIVVGNTAHIAGDGQINGSGDYSFEVWMTDGNLGGGAGGDTFRIRIVDNATGAVVFDNGTPASLAGGNLKIHS